ncbi:hypothetical protein CAP35_12050 [Chitinophagaceae bacterium IBVUCB1]|nr:hypothetical protein CAP35_12050 [Chitinophagaceae bacterium IBVUCB1]
MRTFCYIERYLRQELIHTSKHPYALHHVKLSNGSNIAYIDEGSGGQTILFVHGLATYGRSWQYQIDELKKHYRCIAIDLPGNGYSDRGRHDYSIHFFAGCVYDFMQQLKLQNVILAGHSMGGQVVMHLLQNMPQAATKLILCAPAGFETFSPMESSMYKSTISMLDMFSTEENSLRQSIRTSFFKYPQHIDEMVEELIHIMRSHSVRNYRQMIDACVNGMLDEPVFDKLHQITQPTLVLYGERDALIPNRWIHPVTTAHIAEDGVMQMPNAQLDMIPQCGHFLQLEKPHLVNAAIRNFVG